jgi:aspartate-semialdehyde dehydrogenase
VGILGATGMVGQRMLQLLSKHPFFQPDFLAASSRSAGKQYSEACRWRLADGVPDKILNQRLYECEPERVPSGIQIIFSALDSSVAGPIEKKFQEAGFFVITNASAWRMASDVPMIIPEVNPEALQILGKAPTSGIIANPNCCVIPLCLALAPLHERWGVEAVIVSTYQAVSGAGYPGESAWDMIGNVHPHAGNEEQKLIEEPPKILGGSIPISARCVRVPTTDGHLLGIHVKLKNSPTTEEVAKCMTEWRPKIPLLPSSPTPILRLMTQRDRPSPRFDIHAGNGMAISVGRIEPCPILGIKFFALGHNTIRGAAGAAIVNAELLIHHLSASEPS